MDYKELSKILGCNEYKAERFYYILFDLIISQTRNPELNTIHLQEFGKFYVKKITIDKLIQAYINQIRKGKNVDKAKERIRLLWEARKGKSYNRI